MQLKNTFVADHFLPTSMRDAILVGAFRAFSERLFYIDYLY